MSPFPPPTSPNSNLALLRNKTVVLSGGATGIGAATLRVLVQHGANVVFGDLNVSAAEALVQELSSTTSAGKADADADMSRVGQVIFVRCDVSKHADVVALFRAAWEGFGGVDHAVACAGIFERGDWFDAALTRENIGEREGDASVLDVNVLGTLIFARVAVVFMRKEAGEVQEAGDGEGRKGREKSLTLLSSVNAFRESPGLFMYQTSKHAVQGFMRASRKPLMTRHGIRVNCVCPGVTETPMTVGIVEKFKAADLFWQPASAVADIILAIQCNGEMAGKAIYVEGGEGWEFEDSLNETQSTWLGEEPTRRMRANTEAVMKGVLTSK